MDVNKAINLKNRVVALQKVNKRIETLKKKINCTSKIMLHEMVDVESSHYLRIDQPYEIKDIIEFIIKGEEKIKEDLEFQIKNDY